MKINFLQNIKKISLTTWHPVTLWKFSLLLLHYFTFIALAKQADNSSRKCISLCGQQFLPMLHRFMHFFANLCTRRMQLGCELNSMNALIIHIFNESISGIIITSSMVSNKQWQTFLRSLKQINRQWLVRHMESLLCN